MTKPIYRNMTFQVLTAIAIGVLIGVVKPQWGVALDPVKEGFLRLVKMVVAPIIFLTIVVGIASMGDLKKVGRVGIKAFIYFEVMTTIALAIGMVVANVVQPGKGFTAGAASATPVVVTPTTLPSTLPTTLPTTSPSTQPATMPAVVAASAQPGGGEGAKKPQTTTEFLLGIIPDNIVGAFATGNLLQVLFFSVLFGIAVASLGLKNTRLMSELEHLTEVMFRLVGLIMKVAPLGAMAAMAWTVGKYGLGSLVSLGKLMLCVYLTMFLFIVCILGPTCRLVGIRLWRFLGYIKEEILLVLGTSSSESALPRMIEKLELLGCSRGVVGLVVPSGYSFNLDGTSIYLSMAVLFAAQTQDMHLTIGQQVAIMFILMLTSKGAAAVTGAGLVTLKATIDSTHIPAAAISPLVGVDRFMSEARAITNLIGNGVATVVVSKWEGEFDPAQCERALSGHALDLPPAGGFPVEVKADVAREPNAGIS